MAVFDFPISFCTACRCKVQEAAVKKNCIQVMMAFITAAILSWHEKESIKMHLLEHHACQLMGGHVQS